MAAVAYVLITPLNLDTAGWPVVEARYFLVDPAYQPRDGSGYDPRQLSVVVALDPSAPTDWDKSIENAVIADAAAQTPSFVVTAARCHTPVMSESLIKESHSYQTPLTGFTITIGNNVRELILDPAGTLASGTLTLPGNPQNGRHINIMSTQAITALTLNPNTGQTIQAGAGITTLPANGFVEYVYRATQNKWIRAG